MVQIGGGGGDLKCDRTNDLTGDLTGDFIGDLTGDLRWLKGNSVGNSTGDLIERGDLIGDLMGDLIGLLLLDKGLSSFPESVVPQFKFCSASRFLLTGESLFFSIEELFLKLKIYNVSTFKKLIFY